MKRDEEIKIPKPADFKNATFLPVPIFEKIREILLKEISSVR
ncbi:MAG: hypothetical protein ABIR78_00810 [Ferruginibacter sp.]